MDNKDDIFDLLSSKVSTQETLTENDWLKIDQKYKKGLFYKWSFDRMNIYYASLITLTFVSTLLLMVHNFKQVKTIENIKPQIQNHNMNRDSNRIESTPTQTTNSKNAYPCTPERSTYNENPNSINTRLKDITKNTLPEHKESNYSLDTNKSNNSKIPQQSHQDLIIASSKEEMPIESPKKIKLPVIIYQQDTIFDIDSTKVSRRKISRMNN